MAVEEVIIRATLQGDLERGLRGARTEAEHLEQILNRLGRAGGPGGAGGGLGNTNRQASALMSTLNGLNRTAGSFLHWIGEETEQAAQRGITALGLLGAAAVATGVKMSAAYEMQKTAFRALAGNTEGDNLFQWARQFNLKTPFSQEQINSAVQLGLSSGAPVEQIRPLTEAAANLAAASGDFGNISNIARVIGQVSTSGKLYAQEARQFMNANVPILDIISENTGVDKALIRRQMTQGQLNIPSDQLMGWLAGMQGPTLQRLQGIAGEQGQTLTGVWRRSIDNIKIALADASAPLTEGLKKRLPEATDMITDFISKDGDKLFSVVEKGLNLGITLMKTVEPVLDAIINGLDTLSNIPVGSGSLLEQIGGQLGLAITDFFAAIGPRMPEYVDAFLNLAMLAPSFVNAMTGMLPLVDPLVKLFNTIMGNDVMSKIAGYIMLFSVMRNASGFGGGGLIPGLGPMLQLMMLSRMMGIGGAAGGAGMLGGLGAMLLPAAGIAAGGGAAAWGLSKDKAGVGSFLATAGGGAAMGAGIGALFGGVGAAPGALIGGALGAGVYGLRHLWGGDGDAPQAVQTSQYGLTAQQLAQLDPALRNVPSAGAVGGGPWGAGTVNNYNINAPMDFTGSGASQLSVNQFGQVLNDWTSGLQRRGVGVP